MINASLITDAQVHRFTPNCPLHIIIALDFSGSEREYIDEIRTSLFALTSSFELDQNSLQIGLISFNRGARVLLPLSGDTDLLKKTIEELRIPTTVYATDIHSAIELADQQFRALSRKSIPKFFVLVSDGDPHAHSRGFGFQEDLINIHKLRKGDSRKGIDPVHVFSLYSGRVTPYRNDYSELVRTESIEHMMKIASDRESFFYFDELAGLVDFFVKISSCL